MNKETIEKIINRVIDGATDEQDAKIEWILGDTEISEEERTQRYYKTVYEIANRIHRSNMADKEAEEAASAYKKMYEDGSLNIYLQILQQDTTQ